MARPADHRLVIIIDNAHRLRDERILAQLAELVAVHNWISFVFCTRIHHPIERIAAGSVDIVSVPAHQLLFHQADIRELAASLGTAVTDKQAEHLLAATAGWPAVVRLIIEEFIETGQLATSRGAAYVHETVLAACDHDRLHGLLSLALAERATHAMVAYLRHSGHRVSSVEDVEATGLVERIYAEDDIVLTAPRLLRDAVARHFEIRNPAAVRDAHQALSRWHAAQASSTDLALALRHAALGESWSRVVSIWHRHAAKLTAEHPRELAEALGRVPPEVLDRWPAMLVGRHTARTALSMDAQDPDQAAAVLHAYAMASFRDGHEKLHRLPAPDLLYVGAGSAVWLRQIGQFAEAARMAAAIAARADRLVAGGQAYGDARGWFELQRGASHMMLGDWDGALRSFETAWAHRKMGPMVVSTMVTGYVALTHAWSGQRVLARRSLSQANGAVGSPYDGAQTPSLLAMGLLALDRLDREGSATVLKSVEAGWVPPTLRPVAVWLRAQHGLQYDDAASALARLTADMRAGRAGIPNAPLTSHMLTHARLDLHIAAGQADRAAALRVECGEIMHSSLAVPSARLKLMTGLPAAARREIAEHLWSATTNSRTRLQLLLIDATSALRLDERAQSREAMKRAIGIYAESRLLQPFASVGWEDLVALLDNSGEQLDDDDLSVIHATPSPFPRALDLIRLTRRERELTTALGNRASRQDLADHFNVSVNTVRKQLGSLYRKLGVRSRAEALVKLAELGLIDE